MRIGIAKSENSRIFAVIWLTAAVLCGSCAARQTDQTAQTQPSAGGSGRTVVLWLSIDGLRHDYVERDAAKLPTLSRLMHEGEYTDAMVPVFPSITWASHVSEATGVPVDQNGIANNSFRDVTMKKSFNMPGDSSLIQAEPIWITAARQHVRDAVLCWPMCGEQSGAVKPDYFAKYSGEEDDPKRLENALKVWRDDDPAKHDGQPLRLIMFYVSGIDTAGHKFGPDAPQISETLETLDHHLGDFVKGAEEIFKQKMQPQDKLYFVITTDHGMSPLKEQLIMENVIGEDLAKGAHIENGGAVSNIYLDDLPESERAARADAIVKKLHEDSRVEAWKRDDLPKEFHYNNPTRVGDVVVMAKIGYSWRNKPKGSSRPASATSSMRGNHGYWVGEDPDMLGFALIYEFGHNLGGKNLGRVDSLRFNPTVAKLLGIEPASGVKGEPIDVPQ